MHRNKMQISTLTLAFILVGLIASAVQGQTEPHGPQTMLIEAEAFDDLGGWVVDQQSMDIMGSPYLLAHGLGVPVRDASTTVKLSVAGDYRVFVRTRDWVAPWKAPGAPGKFQVLINSQPLAATFGTAGAAWHWQSGGHIPISAVSFKLALHDLTGFEGRCDAILLTTSNDLPPDDGPALASFRKRLLNLPDEAVDGGKYDLVVVGGGIAGMCAATASSRLGLSVALIQDRPLLGGNNSSEIRVWLNGDTNKEPYPHIGDVVNEFEPKRRKEIAPAAWFEDAERIAKVREAGVKLFLNEHVNQAETIRLDASQRRIATVTSQNTRSAQRTRFSARWFVDCTGDGTLGYLAGADYDMTAQGHQGGSNLWDTVDTHKPIAFPRCPWAYDLSQKPFPDEPREWGKWFWESGFDRHPIDDVELMRDNNLRAMYGAWDALKNVRHKYPNHQLNWAAYVMGKRESRRLLGDVVLSREDLVKSVKYDDGCVPTSWSIDVHLADPKYADGFADPFISYVASHYQNYPRPYWVPYRLLYSRNVINLWMAGRDISVSHEALGTTRVQRTTGMMGEVVGMAASICKLHDGNPRQVYSNYLVELKQMMLQGVGAKDTAK